jgi:flagellar P-ring protein precursor FlgI
MTTPRRLALGLALLLAVAVSAGPARGQEVRIGDLTRGTGEIPVRLVGYGLVTGLDGTGDRAIGGFGAGHTVQSIANLLRRFGVEVPEQLLRTLNVAAVLVTAEVSPYLRPGGRFDVQVASLGDATSLRGGVLWMTPMLAGVGATPMATAQGGLLTSGAPMNAAYDARSSRPVETSARIAGGGILEQPLPRTAGEGDGLILLQPNLGTAVAIAEAVNGALGPGTAIARDPGAIDLDLSGTPAEERLAVLSSIREFRVTPVQDARIVIDGRDGSVVTGGEIRVGAAVVSHSGITLTVSSSVASTEVDPSAAPGAAADSVPATGGRFPTSPDALPDPFGGPAGEPFVPGAVRIATGVTTQELADALHDVGVTPDVVASIFDSLARVGAISAEVVVR